jgi:anaerobic magnesium-protoporphyrin IX monomethyl ester cyclase
MASKKFLSTGAFLPPLGILYLGQMLENHGHTVEVIDCSAQTVDLNTLKKAVHSHDVIGITIYSELKELNNSITLSHLIKEIDPHFPIIIGGPHCSYFPIQAIKEHHADICVQGHAELVINPIIKGLEGKRKLSTIPGIVFKEGNRIRRTKPPEKIKNLDVLPFPARHLVEQYKYGTVMGIKMAKGKTTSVITSRGCPYNCRFCGIHTHVPHYQSRSITNITTELEKIIDEGYTTIDFVDDNFLVQKKKVEKIMDFIKQKDADVKLWIADARADAADKNLYKKMKEAGVELINYGIESGNQDVLDFYNKKLTLSQIRDTVYLSKEMGFFTGANFILGAPFETKKHINNTIKFAKSLPLDYATFYILGYIIGSDLRKEAEKDGKIKPDEIRVCADSRRGLGNFTEEELLGYTMKAYKEFFYNPYLWLRELRFTLTKKDFKYLRLGFGLLTNR